MHDYSKKLIHFCFVGILLEFNVLILCIMNLPKGVECAAFPRLFVLEHHSRSSSQSQNDTEHILGNFALTHFSNKILFLQGPWPTIFS